jgi:hypothetical protein
MGTVTLYLPLGSLPAARGALEGFAASFARRVSIPWLEVASPCGGSGKSGSSSRLMTRSPWNMPPIDGCTFFGAGPRALDSPSAKSEVEPAASPSVEPLGASASSADVAAFASAKFFPWDILTSAWNGLTTRTVSAVLLFDSSVLGALEGRVSLRLAPADAALLPEAPAWLLTSPLGCKCEYHKREWMMHDTNSICKQETGDSTNK